MLRMIAPTRSMASFLLLLFSYVCIGVAQQGSSKSNFTPRFVNPKQATKKIDKYSIATPQLADQQLRPSDMVLGIALGNASRAYPLNMISTPTRELYNDQLAGEPILVSWCSLCYSAAVYDRKTKDGVLEFGIAGSLWNDNMVMYDSKTKSLWSQIRGEAMSGGLKGEFLKRIPADVMSWYEWKKRYPNTTVAIFTRTSDEFYQKNVGGLDELMTAFVSDNSARGWMFSQVRGTPVINDSWQGHKLLVVRVDESGSARLFSRVMGEVELDFFLTEENQLKDEQTGTTWNAFTGKALSGPLEGNELQRLTAITVHKKKWESFYPNTEIFRN